jgi:hypothetical protein
MGGISFKTHGVQSSKFAAVFAEEEFERRRLIKTVALGVADKLETE